MATYYFLARRFKTRVFRTFPTINMAFFSDRPFFPFYRLFLTRGHAKNDQKPSFSIGSIFKFHHLFSQNVSQNTRFELRRAKKSYSDARSTEPFFTSIFFRFLTLATLGSKMKKNLGQKNGPCRPRSEITMYCLSPRCFITV